MRLIEKSAPGNYDGREHQFIKHIVLKSYLERLLMIIGLHYTEICYVDTFAGPWCDDSDDLSGTSINISLKIMEQCQVTLKEKHNKNVTFRALYIEKNKIAFSRLKAFLGSRKTTVRTECLNGDSELLCNEVLAWCGPSAFTFFFIDPTQWTPIMPSKLEPLLKRKRSEFLINFMYDFINRAVDNSEFEEYMLDMYGEPLQLEGLSPKEREKTQVKKYKDRIKQLSACNDSWAAHVTILQRVKDRPHYHLIYLSKNCLGICIFMEESEKVDIVQKKIHLDTKLKQLELKSGITDMFATLDPASDNMKKDLNEIKEYWLRVIPFEYKQFTYKEFANILEDTGWLPLEHQAALGELIQAGKIENPSWTRKRTTYHVRFSEKESLRRIE